MPLVFGLVTPFALGLATPFVLDLTMPLVFGLAAGASFFAVATPFDLLLLDLPFALLRAAVERERVPDEFVVDEPFAPADCLRFAFLVEVPADWVRVLGRVAVARAIVVSYPDNMKDRARTSCIMPQLFTCQSDAVTETESVFRSGVWR